MRGAFILVAWLYFQTRLKLCTAKKSP